MSNNECNLVTVSNIQEPIKAREFPTAPWVDIAMDFCGPLPSGHYLFVIIDYYSRYKEVVVMERITSRETIFQLRRIFALFGLPQTITADNGRQFVSREFEAFCVENGIRLFSTPPYWPQANGLVERQNNSILKRLRISAATKDNNWQKDLQSYLLADRNTPHPATGFSPAELMFGRPTRTKIPAIQDNLMLRSNDAEARENDATAKMKMKAYTDKHRNAKPSLIDVGDIVLVRKEKRDNKLDMPYKDEQYEVLRKHNADVTLKSTKTGDIVRRNITHLKLYTSKPQADQSGNTISSDDDSESSEELNQRHVQSQNPKLPKLKIQLKPTPKCTTVDDA